MKEINSIRLQRLLINEQVEYIKKNIELRATLRDSSSADPEIISRVQEVIDEYEEYERILSELTNWAKSQIDTTEEKKEEEN